MRQDPNNYWEQLERLEKLIRAAELKAGIIFSFHSLILGLFVDRYSYFQDAFMGSTLLITLSGLWILSVLISIYFCFQCFMPRIDTKNDKNVFFFKDATYAFGSVKEYTKTLIEICDSEEELFEMLGQQIFIESKIIDRKFDSVQKSLRFFAVSFMFVIVMLVVWLITS